LQTVLVQIKELLMVFALQDGRFWSAPNKQAQVNGYVLIIMCGVMDMLVQTLPKQAVPVAEAAAARNN
jgi:hypothetical protein